jgi:hypothetical protein
MRNVDFNLQHIAMLRVSDLIKEIIKETWGIIKIIGLGLIVKGFI